MTHPHSHQIAESIKARPHVALRILDVKLVAIVEEAKENHGLNELNEIIVYQFTISFQVFCVNTANHVLSQLDVLSRHASCDLGDKSLGVSVQSHRLGLAESPVSQLTECGDAGVNLVI